MTLELNEYEATGLEKVPQYFEKSTEIAKKKNQKVFKSGKKNLKKYQKKKQKFFRSTAKFQKGLKSP